MWVQGDLKFDEHVKMIKKKVYGKISSVAGLRQQGRMDASSVLYARLTNYLLFYMCEFCLGMDFWKAEEAAEYFVERRMENDVWAAKIDSQ
jgi:hypothetical protein